MAAAEAVPARARRKHQVQDARTPVLVRAGPGQAGLVQARGVCAGPVDGLLRRNVPGDRGELGERGLGEREEVGGYRDGCGGEGGEAVGELRGRRDREREIERGFCI